MTDEKQKALLLRWRIGRSVGRTIYAQEGLEPSDNDLLIGMMDSRILAADAVASHNALLDTKWPYREDALAVDPKLIKREGRI